MQPNDLQIIDAIIARAQVPLGESHAVLEAWARIVAAAQKGAEEAKPEGKPEA